MTINAFQCGKADSVVLADLRLQYNSYWAKDGTQSGHCAKAQEILGQVRGRCGILTVDLTFWLWRKSFILSPLNFIKTLDI
ncbi:hypothetical protein Ancab_027831 [Ancistrocladus abbreviatus]